MKHIEGYAAGESKAVHKSISTSDLIHFCGNWVWRALEALVQAEDFNPSPAWIADRLNISLEAAKDALEGLERIGVIKATNGVVTPNADFTSFDGVEVDRSDRFEIHNKIQNQILNRLTSRDSYCNAVLLSSKENIEEFYKNFCTLVEDLNNKSLTQGKSKDVYAIELSLAKLTREQK